MTRGFVLALIIVALTTAVAAGTTVTILYTNDLHARVEQLAGLSAAIAQARAAAPGPVLLFDSGDTWQDYRVPIYAVWGADQMVAWMNKVGYTAMELGNHDLYYGPDRLAALIHDANFPILCANLRPVPGISAPFRPYTFVRAGTLRVLVIGVITPQYLPYFDYPWLTYIDPAQAIADILKRQGKNADLVVVLGHLPVAAAEKITRRVPGINVFLTGHSHELTTAPVHVEKTIILQAGAFGRHLGKLTVDIDASHTVTTMHNTFIPIKNTPVDQAPGYRRLGAVIALIAAAMALLFLR